MSVLQNFSFDGHPVRVVDVDGEQCFVGKDVADRLGYANTADALKQHCRGVAKRYPIVDALGRKQEVRILSEPDVLRLIVNSKLPGAERFERWIFEDVLPAIRRTGRYDPSPASLPGDRFGFGSSLFKQKMEMLATAERLFGAEGARRVWADLGFTPMVERSAVYEPSFLVVEPVLEGEAEGWACLKHMLDAKLVRSPVRELLPMAFEGVRIVQAQLLRFGIRLTEAEEPLGLTVWADSRQLRHTFGTTRWYKNGWADALSRLPGAIARHDQDSSSNNSRTRETVFLPYELLSDPRAQ